MSAEKRNGLLSLLSKDMLPNTDTGRSGDPYFSLFCQVTFAQTMFLFFESIFVLVLWNADSPHSVFNQFKFGRCCWQKEDNASKASSTASSATSSVATMSNFELRNREPENKVKDDDSMDGRDKEEEQGSCDILKVKKYRHTNH